MKSPLISIIMPVYNVEKYLDESVGSILRQTYRNLEVILVDDGSTDNSPAMCDEYAGLDSRVKVIHKQNGGQSEARNAGFETASGEYTYFLDSDDYIAETTIAECLAVAEKEQADFVFFDAECIFEKESDREKWDISYKRKREYKTDEGYKVLSLLQANKEYDVSIPMKFIRTEYLHSTNLTLYNGIIHEDILYIFQLFLYAKKVAHINKPLYFRRVSPDSTMTTRISSRNFIGYFTVILEMLEIYKDEKFPPDKQQLVRNYIIRVIFICARLYCNLSYNERKKIKAERKLLRRGLKEMQYLNSFRVRLTCGNIIVLIYMKGRELHWKLKNIIQVDPESSSR